VTRGISVVSGYDGGVLKVLQKEARRFSLKAPCEKGREPTARRKRATHRDRLEWAARTRRRVPQGRCRLGSCLLRPVF
jgi:hypothetical protein